MNLKFTTRLAAIALALLAPALHAQTAYTENFTGTSTTNSWYFLNGGCLTAGTPSTTSAANPACKGLPYYVAKGDSLKGGLPDTISGALRFTGATNNENGAILSNFNFPLAAQGLAVSFTTVTWGGNSGGSGADGADGMSFFLQDATFPADVGAFGGSLGYTCSNSNNDGTLRSSGIPRGYDGLQGGYIGLGIDEYGNFLNQGDNTATGYGYVPGRIGMRGPGNITWASLNAAYPTQYPSILPNASKAAAVQYTCKTGGFQDWSYVVYYAANCLLGIKPLACFSGQSPTLPASFVPTVPLLDYAAINGAYKVLPTTQKIANESATTRSAAIPITYNLKITKAGLLSLAYSYNGGALQNVITNQDITLGGSQPLPANIRFGFAGSTGGSTNVHEIMCFQATPTNVAQSSAGLNQKQVAKVQVGTQVYFAYYSPTTLAGSLTSQYLDQSSTNLNDLTIDPAVNWDGSCVLTGVPSGQTCNSTGPAGPIAAQGPTQRTILTWNGTTGVAFKWDSGGTTLTSAQQTAIDTGDSTATVPPNYNYSRVQYLRGDRSEEQTPTSATTFTGAFRTRASVLGDIVDSSPTWVGPPTSPYTGTWSDLILGTADTMVENSGQSYSTFMGSSGALTRTNVVYAGANDGMLHAFRTGSFDASKNYVKTYNDGQELLAYMPGYIVSTIQSAFPAANYSDPQYGHHFDVDAPPGTGDLYYGNAWHTWLVGGLGPGGAAIYALDITNPDDSSNTANNSFSEAHAANIVKGEWTAATLTCSNVSNCGTNNLGKTYGVPQIRRFHNGQWGAVFGNGFGSSVGEAGIYVMLLDKTSATPTFYYYGTGSKPSNGIAYVTAADLDGDHVTDYVYAGDLLGNVWRFDLTDKDPTKWGTSSSPMYTTPSGQPITTKVIVASITGTPFPRILVEFGTGRQTPITNSQANTYLTAQQALYGIWDWNLQSWNSKSTTKYGSLASGPSSLAGTSNLVQQSILTTATATTTGTGSDYRSITNYTLCFADDPTCTTAKYGWYLNLAYGNAYPTDPAVPQTGNSTYINNPVVYEQAIFSPILEAGTFIINTTIPPASAPTMCFSSGASGWTMAINPATGGSFTSSFFGDTSGNFLTMHDSASNNVAVSGVALSGTGSGSIVIAATQDYYVTQTVSGTGVLIKSFPQGNTTGIDSLGFNAANGHGQIYMNHYTRARGLTLIELVVSMLIVGILAAIAIPSYSAYTRKAHRTDAKTALLDLAALEERYYTTQAAYTDDQTKLGYGGAASTAFLVGSGYYMVSIVYTNAVAPTSVTSVGSPANYTLTATAQGGQLKDTQCVKMILTSTGLQTSQDASSTDTTTTGGCWN